MQKGKSWEKKSYKRLHAIADATTKVLTLQKKTN